MLLGYDRSVLAWKNNAELTPLQLFQQSKIVPEDSAEYLEIMRLLTVGLSSPSVLGFSLYLCSDLHLESTNLDWSTLCPIISSPSSSSSYSSSPVNSSFMQPSEGSLSSARQPRYLALLGNIGQPNTEEGWQQYRQFLLAWADEFDRVFVVAGNQEYYFGTLTQTETRIRMICQEHDRLTFLQNQSFLLPELNGSSAVRVLGTTLWSNVAENNLKRVQYCVADYIQIHNDEGQRLRVADTNKLHEYAFSSSIFFTGRFKQVQCY